MSSPLTLVPLLGMPEADPKSDLSQLVVDALAHNHIELQPQDILVVAQKLVSRVENRYRFLGDVHPSLAATMLGVATDKDPRLVELILQQCVRVVRFRKGLLVVEHYLGLVHANAGIDQSNTGRGSDWVLLLPEAPDASASGLRQALYQHCGVAPAVLVNDSMGRAWREGVIGHCIGCSGLLPLIDMFGYKDLDGRPLQATTVAKADELAAAASILMGQADEAIPAVLIRGMAMSSETGTAKDLIRCSTLDLFR